MVAQPTALKIALATDERSYAWLARKLDVSRVTVKRWADGTHEIPDAIKPAITRHLGRNVFDPTNDSERAAA